MANANERVDRLIRHQIGLLRVGDNVARQIISVLNNAEAGIVAKLVDLDPNEVTRSKYRQERLERLLEAVRDINTGVYRQMRGELNSELKPIAAAEIEFQDRLLRAGTNLRIGLPTVETAYAAALARPFQGRLLKEMYAGIEAGAKERLRNAIRMGFVEGESVSDVVRRIRGTRSSGYRDGILEINRKDAYRVARTAVSHTAAVARQAVYEANADIAQGVIWTSVLDTRTSPICAARSQKAYTPAGKPIGHNLAWLGGPGRAHFNCRSTGVLWLKDEEKPEGLSYQKWLERQPVEVQKDILGPTKYKLWKQGGVPLERFVERKGGPLTIAQLRKREAAAFDARAARQPKARTRPTGFVPRNSVERSYLAEFDSSADKDFIGAFNATKPVDIVDTARGGFYVPDGHKMHVPKNWESLPDSRRWIVTFAHEYGHAIDMDGRTISTPRSISMADAVVRDRDRLASGGLAIEPMPQKARDVLEDVFAKGDPAAKRVETLLTAGRFEDALDAFEQGVRRRDKAIGGPDGKTFYDYKFRGMLNDYIGSVTDLKFGRGHSLQYYRQFETIRADSDGGIVTVGHVAEAFANAFAAHTLPGRVLWEYIIRSMAPNTAKAAKDLVRSIADGQ